MTEARRSTEPLALIGGFESTFMPQFDTDVAETSGHIERRREDLQLLRSCGVERLRYPIRWHRVAPRPRVFDWSETDEVMDALRELDLVPIVDLVHHTSYPAWLTDGFADRRFPAEYLRYVEAFAARYPDVREYTLFNEPFSTLLLCGHEAAWPPYGAGMASFVPMLSNVLPAIAQAARHVRDILPGARHVWVDSCEHHTSRGAAGTAYARYANDRRFFVLDAVTGMIDAGADRPFVEDVLDHGGRSLLEIEPCTIDVLGLDYYAHCQWHFDPDRGYAPSPEPIPLATLIEDYSRRYGVACMLTETNIRGTGSDRATWFKYVLEQCERARAAGVDLEGVCWFPFVDSCDWDSLLRRCTGSVDPVGVVTVAGDRQRRFSAMTASFLLAARGATSDRLPAYALQEPVATWLAGYRSQMDHWSWQEPPIDEVVRYDLVARDYAPLGAVATVDVRSS
jgi:beta-glucosidase/6-phospho-beta-glucosidase/beta-galactosidase